MPGETLGPIRPKPADLGSQRSSPDAAGMAETPANVAISGQHRGTSSAHTKSESGEGGIRDGGGVATPLTGSNRRYLLFEHDLRFWLFAVLCRRLPALGSAAGTHLGLTQAQYGEARILGLQCNASAVTTGGGGRSRLRSHLPGSIKVKHLCSPPITVLYSQVLDSQVLGVTASLFR